MTDFAPDQNLNRVARITADLGQRIREEDPDRLFGELINLCHDHPAKAAQIIMCFAAWFDIEQKTDELVARARAASAYRAAGVRIGRAS